MFATALIVFRESLEAALFVGIVAAASRGLAGRWRWLVAGVAAGMLGAALLALLAESLSGWLDGLGQDVVNILILALALLMLLWHCIWVTGHARTLAGQARSLGQSVQRGRQAPRAVLLVVALSVLREGAESVLFIGGALAGASGAVTGQLLLAGGLGLGAGALVGGAVYLGLARVPARHAFAVTHVLMSLLAASLASQLVRALVQAGYLEAGSGPLWDSSALLAPDSALGALLHALMGYEARPMGAQLASYLAVLACIAVGTRLFRPAPVPSAS
jgi:high-affinity iron transporter